MKTKLLVLAMLAASAGLVFAYPRGAQVAPTAATSSAPAAPVAATRKPKVEVVFVLDTTGSMGGLIQAAKENIWAIASSMAQAQPAPEIKIGLVAFRDRGDQYVTKVVDLSSDLDSMYATLMDFKADGGGDTPEAVNTALDDAVRRISWSQGDDAYRVVFLVGDAPPHMDYPDEPKYPDVVKAATARGIVVNTILAGGDPGARAEWQRIASLNQGRFFEVEQSGSAVAVATPFDEKIAELSKSLDDTRMFYGDAAAQHEATLKVAATDKLHAEGSAAARAKRAAFNASAAGKVNALGENDLVDAVASGRVALDKVKQADLPAPLRGLDQKAQALASVDAGKRRSELNAQIAQLAAQRKGFIDEKLAARDGAKDSLDYQVYSTVKEQAGKKGIRYEAAAPAN
jgi:Mg-chelatase subunit ChlD